MHGQHKFKPAQFTAVPHFVGFVARQLQFLFFASSI